jgi:hypothetical protein
VGDHRRVKRILLAGSVVAMSALSVGGLAAWALGSTGPEDDMPGSEKAPSVVQAPQAEGTGEDPAQVPEEAAGIHGGVIGRFHAPGGCSLISTGGLPGNWTHGDYVTAVAGLGDAALVVEAAHSDCGKPLHAEGSGPPAHALEHGEKNGLGVGGAPSS